MAFDPPLDKWRTLRQGMSGRDVSAWQRLLISDDHSLRPYGADGSFGKLTQKRSIAWQMKRRLTPDGIIGPRTRIAIERETNGVSPVQADPEASTGLVLTLEQAGLKVQDRRVPGRPYPFEPAGIVVHHTASRGPADLPSLGTVLQGRAGLSGPLCHVLIGRKVTEGDSQTSVVVCTDGLANHAGPGRSGVLKHVRSEEPLTPDMVSWGVRDDDGGNRWYYGIEIENCGTDDEPFPPTQYATAVSVARAICAAHGWGKFRVIGHKEHTRRKPVDPNFDMGDFREALKL